MYGNIYAFTSDGFIPREVKDWAETVQSQVLQLKDVGKVDLIGNRDSVIYIKFSTRKLAAPGLDQRPVLDTLAQQNAIVPSGVARSAEEQVLVRATGRFTGVSDMASVALRVGDTCFTLADVATVTLQCVSLGTLIIALGLSVDDAMIAIETMISRLEIGETLDKAASYVGNAGLCGRLHTHRAEHFSGR